jgi:hypothetical protein
MGLLNRKSKLERLLDSAGDSLNMPDGVKNVGSGKPVKAGLLAAGGLAALTAASAGISSLRRRVEGAGDDS